MIRVLIADDARIIREMLGIFLRGECETDFAGTGREAVETYVQALAEGRPHQVILMDLDMPQLNGEAAIRAIRAAEQAAGAVRPARIVLITSDYSLRRIMADLKDCGVDECLLKPVDRKQVIDCVRRAAA